MRHLETQRRSAVAWSGDHPGLAHFSAFDTFAAVFGCTDGAWPCAEPCSSVEHSIVSLIELLLIILYLTSPLQDFAKAGADMYTFHIEAAAEGMESRGLEAHAQLLFGSCHGQAGNRGPPHALCVPSIVPSIVGIAQVLFSV